MRIVLGYSPAIPELVDGTPFPGRSDEMLTYGHERANLVWNPLTTDVRELESQYPKGWRPDLFCCASLEYFAIPRGIEEIDCLTVGVVGDWNLGGQAIQMVAGAFDLIVADYNGCERLKHAGFPNVLYSPLWSYDPSVHRRLPDVQRDIDVLMIGNFNHEVQRERAKWLARVAKLSRKYKVVITSGLYGEDYTRLMNRAKIVFNRSIRGELNMRAYEAPACGALMMYERGNPEIGGMLRDGESCVLYGDDDLETLIDRYLAGDAERIRIAENGCGAVTDFTWSRQGAQLLDTIEAGYERLRSESRRSFRDLSRGERLARRACQWLAMPTRDIDLINGDLSQAERLMAERADVVHARAMTLYESVVALAPGNTHRQATLKLAVREELRALAQQPDFASAWFGTAAAHLELGETAAAQRALLRVADILDMPFLRPDQVRGPYPLRYDAFRTEMEMAWTAAELESDAWTAAVREVLRWRAFEQLSDLQFAEGRIDESERSAGFAVAQRPCIGTTRYRLGRAQRANGKFNEAIDSFALALEDAALDHTIWTEYAQTLLEAGSYDRCRILLDGFAAILDGCPPMEWYRSTLNSLAAAATHTEETRSKQRYRLLAFPDWNRPEEWQTLLSAYVAQCGDRDTTLLLPVHAQRHPSPARVESNVEQFLSVGLGLDLNEIPDVVLVPRTGNDARDLYSRADALVDLGDDNVLSHPPIPVVPLDALNSARDGRVQSQAA